MKEKVKSHVGGGSLCFLGKQYMYKVSYWFIGFWENKFEGPILFTTYIYIYILHVLNQLAFNPQFTLLVMRRNLNESMMSIVKLKSICERGVKIESVKVN